jgi:hypothetical protein
MAEINIDRIGGSGSSTNPGGVDTNVQYNDNGVFGGTTQFNFDGNNVAMGKTVGSKKLEVSSTDQCVATFGNNITGAGITFTDNTTTDDETVGVGAFGDNLCFRSGGSVAGNMRLDSNGNLGINENTPTARLHVKGSGTTSATTSLLVKNSAGVDMIKITDDITTTIGNQFNIIRTTVPSQLIEINANFSTIAAGIRAGGNSKDFVISATGSRDLYLSTNFASNITQVQFALKHNQGVLIKDNASTAMDASARLEVASTTQGFLPPRMTTAQKLAIATPAAGLMVYDTDLNKLCVYTTAWEIITSA